MFVTSRILFLDLPFFPSLRNYPQSQKTSIEAEDPQTLRSGLAALVSMKKKFLDTPETQHLRYYFKFHVCLSVPESIRPSIQYFFSLQPYAPCFHRPRGASKRAADTF